jgi:hypothetical protein
MGRRSCERKRTSAEGRTPASKGILTRALGCRTLAEFFAAPLAGDRGNIRLIVDNERTLELER